MTQKAIINRVRPVPGLDGLVGKTALITGASAGIGKTFAVDLAAAGLNLVLTARREDRLADLKAKLEAKYAISVHIIPLDLSQPEAVDTLLQEVGDQEIDLLINNAGIGIYGPFIDIPWERENTMLMLDIINLVRLTKELAMKMVNRNSGYILNVASIGAFQAAPLYGTYSAAKSYVLSFSEALHHELKPAGVQVSALCPGVTRTEFFAAAGQNRLTLFQKLSMMESETVTRIGLRALLAGKPFVIAGRWNRTFIFCYRFLPRRLTTLLAAQAMQGGD